MLYERTLIIAPHPDDDILGCGGLMSKVDRHGGSVHVAVACVANDVRRNELQSACDFLGVEDITVFYDKPDFWLDSLPLNELVNKVESVIQSYKPSAVLIPEPMGFHQEHRAVAGATMAALRPQGGTGRWMPPFTAVYEEPSDVWTLSTDAHRPTWFVELSAIDLERKIAAMDLHVSQVRPEPSERSSMAISALAMLRGSQAGFKYAEAYEVRRCLS